MAIRVFVTGGTFDKEYDELRGVLYFKDTHVSEMLRLGRCRLNVFVSTLMMVDSLDMTDEDRAVIVDHCCRCDEDRIVLTHGTDTIVETASAVARGVADKAVVLTGAMVPYAFGSSDGMFNLGSALSFVQVLPPGVYVAMNGRCFRWDDVRKNRETENVRAAPRRVDRPPARGRTLHRTSTGAASCVPDLRKAPRELKRERQSRYQPGNR